MKNYEKNLAKYRSYVEACDASGLSVTEYAKQQGKKRHYYYNCKKSIRSLEENKRHHNNKVDMPASEIRLPILELHGKTFSLLAYDGVDPTVAITLLAYVMQHEEDMTCGF